jgi:uncharacterized paraquat-inducible protein A|tara:strand:- start:6768 stop:6932 length:165 start_codon:yes stop_codon:yes gene_type:complete
MTVETIECRLCDVEFDIMHTEEAEIEFCPFCGEDVTNKESEDWPDEDIEWEKEQ